MNLSIVIPVLNEERILAASLLDLLGKVSASTEIIVVDGGSHDGTVAMAQEFGRVRVLSSAQGRGHQIRKGCEQAHGDVLLVLHCDVKLPETFEELVMQTCRRHRAGAFQTHHVGDCWRNRPKEYLLRLADFRSRISALPYGDQAVFVTKELYTAVGGYPDQTLMEDLEFAKRVRRHTRFHIVKESVLVSGRRFESAPIWQTLLVNIFPLLYRLGTKPETLLRFYGNPR